MSQGDDYKFLELESQPKALRAVDLVLIVDASGSMSPCIDMLVSKLGVLVDEICTGRAQDSRGNPTQIDPRFGLVAHSSNHGGMTSIYKVDLVGTADIGAIKSGLQRASKIATETGVSEATLHAMDWAMDNISWRTGGHRKMMAVFSDEPISGGDLEGVTPESLLALQAKLGQFSFYLITPEDVVPGADDTTVAAYSWLRRVSGCCGAFSASELVRGSTPADWAQLDFSTIMAKIGQTATAKSHGVDGKPVQRDVFGCQGRYRVESVGGAAAVAAPEAPATEVSPQAPTAASSSNVPRPDSGDADDGWEKR